MTKDNAELIEDARAFMHGRLIVGRDNDIRGHMDRLVAALEATGPRAVVIHTGDPDDRLQAWNEGFAEAQKQWSEDPEATDGEAGDHMTRPEWDEWSNSLAMHTSDRWENDGSQESIIASFMKHYGKLDHLIDELDYEGEVDEVVTFTFNRETDEFTIVEVGPAAESHRLPVLPVARLQAYDLAVVLLTLEEAREIVRKVRVQLPESHSFGDVDRALVERIAGYRKAAVVPDPDLGKAGK